MRLLVRDSYDNALCGYEIECAFIEHAVVVRNYDDDIDLAKGDIVKEYGFQHVVRFGTYGDNSDEIFIVCKEEYLANSLIETITRNGFLDATAYVRSTFISPKDCDIENLEELFNGGVPGPIGYEPERSHLVNLGDLDK